MTKTMLAISVSLAVMTLLAISVDSADNETPATEALIEQLGSKKYVEREQAQQLLRAGGPAVLPALRKALSKSGLDLEVRRRVEKLIPPLQAAAALAPKRVTLTAGKRRLNPVLKEIERQTGFKVGAEDADKEVHDDSAMQRVSFWEALERIGEKTGRVVSVSAENGLRLKRRSARPSLVSINGAFRVEITKMHEDRDIDFTTADQPERRSHLLTLSLSVLAEPRFLILGIETPKIAVVVDEDDRPLRPANLSETTESPEQASAARIRALARHESEHSTKILLQRPSDQTKGIKRLRGGVSVQLVAERRPTLITKQIMESKGMKFKIGEHDLQIARAERDKDGNYHIAIEVPPTADLGDRFSWHTRVRVEDANGNHLKPYSTGHDSRGTNNRTVYQAITVWFNTSKDQCIGPPSRLIVEDWYILNHEIPFEFKDVPLP